MTSVNFPEPRMKEADLWRVNNRAHRSEATFLWRHFARCCARCTESSCPGDRPDEAGEFGLLSGLEFVLTVFMDQPS